MFSLEDSDPGGISGPGGSRVPSGTRVPNGSRVPSGMQGDIRVFCAGIICVLTFRPMKPLVFYQWEGLVE